MKRKNGITLIALIITIIVLLILAGVSIATIVKEDGILNKAVKASEESKKSQITEELKLKLLAIQTEEQGKATLQIIANQLKKDEDNIIISLVPVEDELDQIEEVTELQTNCSEIYVIYKKYQFKIDDKLTVTLLGENNSENLESHQPVYAKKGLRCYLDATVKETKEENQWKDISDNNSNAILYGCQWNENGLYFDGIDDYADLGYHDYGNYTLEVIFETPTLNKHKKLIGNIETGGYSIFIDENNKFRSEAYINSGYKTLTDETEAAQINTKYKMTSTYNGKELKLYINGKLVASSVIEDGLLELPERNTIMAIRS